MAIAVTTSILPSQECAPLDARTVIESLNDKAKIQNPYIGLVFYAKQEGHYYKVIAMEPQTIGLATINVITGTRMLPDDTVIQNIENRLLNLENNQIYAINIKD